MVDVDKLLDTRMIDDLNLDKVVALIKVFPDRRIYAEPVTGDDGLCVEIATDGDAFFILTWQEVPELADELSLLDSKDAPFTKEELARFDALQDTARVRVAQPVSQDELLACLPIPWENENVRLTMAAAKAGFHGVWQYQQKMKDAAKAEARKARALAKAEAKVAKLKAA